MTGFLNIWKIKYMKIINSSNQIKQHKEEKVNSIDINSLTFSMLSLFTSSSKFMSILQ